MAYFAPVLMVSTAPSIDLAAGFDTRRAGATADTVDLTSPQNPL